METTQAIPEDEIAAALAELLSERKGYEILGDWTRRGGRGLVANSPEGALVFIDVRVKRGNGNGFGDTRVTPRMREDFEAAAIDWLARKGDIPDCSVRFDQIVLSVLPENGKAMVRHAINVLA